MVDSIILGCIISYRAIFPVSVQLNHIHPLRQNRNGAKIKSTPTHLYHTKLLGYISSNAHKPDRPHNQKIIHDQQHISEKAFCIASRLADIEKDIPTPYPDITQTVQYQPRSPKPDNHTSHSRQEPYNVIMSERITVQVLESNIVNQSTHTTTVQHTTQHMQTTFPF